MRTSLRRTSITMPDAKRLLLCRYLPIVLTGIIIYWLAGGFFPSIAGTLLQLLFHFSTLWSKERVALLSSLFWSLCQTTTVATAWILLIRLIWKEIFSTYQQSPIISVKPPIRMGHNNRVAPDIPLRMGHNNRVAPDMPPPDVTSLATQHLVGSTALPVDPFNEEISSFISADQSEAITEPPILMDPVQTVEGQPMFTFAPAEEEVLARTPAPQYDQFEAISELPTLVQFHWEEEQQPQPSAPAPEEQPQPSAPAPEERLQPFAPVPEERLQPSAPAPEEQLQPSALAPDESISAKKVMATQNTSIQPPSPAPETFAQRDPFAVQDDILNLFAGDSLASPQSTPSASPEKQELAFSPDSSNTTEEAQEDFAEEDSEFRYGNPFEGPLPDVFHHDDDLKRALMEQTGIVIDTPKKSTGIRKR